MKPDCDMVQEEDQEEEPMEEDQCFEDGFEDENYGDWWTETNKM